VIWLAGLSGRVFVGLLLLTAFPASAQQGQVPLPPPFKPPQGAGAPPPSGTGTTSVALPPRRPPRNASLADWLAWYRAIGLRGGAMIEDPVITGYGNDDYWEAPDAARCWTGGSFRARSTAPLSGPSRAAEFPSFLHAPDLPSRRSGAPCAGRGRWFDGVFQSSYA
jgi:hypothetical protein